MLWCKLKVFWGVLSTWEGVRVECGRQLRYVIVRCCRRASVHRVLWSGFMFDVKELLVVVYVVGWARVFIGMRVCE